MKNDDKKIYLSFIITPLVIAAILAGISIYSLFVVEPRINHLLQSPDTLKEAYITLREPQLFAGYKNWDSEGKVVMNTIRYFDKRLFSGTGIQFNERPYLFLMLERRHAGALLGVKTAVFLLSISICGVAALIIEIKQTGKK